MKLFRKYKKRKQFVRIMQNVIKRFDNATSWEEHRATTQRYFKLFDIYNNNFTYFFCIKVERVMKPTSIAFENSADKAIEQVHHDYINDIINGMREEYFPEIRWEIYQKYIVNHTFFKTNKRAVDCLTNEQIIELTRLL